ncbi:sensor histidine kinase, partial [Staphylococcus aureus]
MRCISLKSITQEIAIVIVIFALFGLMFYLYHLPLEAYLLALGVILLLLLIFIGIKYLSFVKTISQQQQIENLENALYQLKKYYSGNSNSHSYFCFIWLNV